VDDRIRSELALDEDLRDLLHEYVAGLSGTARDMEGCLSTGDSESLARAAHRLRGTGGTYGYPAVTEVCGRIEDAVRGGRPAEEVAELVAGLRSLVPRIEAGLEG